MTNVECIELPTVHSFKDLSGQRFGRWKVLQWGGAVQTGWLCRCDCGFLGFVKSQTLRNKRSAQCQDCHNAWVKEKMTKHAGWKHELYNIWSGMNRRCYEPGNNKYHIYGGRGIKVCKKWKEDPYQFFKDMGPRPSKNYTVDRIDGDGDYAPGNCRWATQKEQQRNRRVQRLITYNGETKCIAEWAEQYGMNQNTLRSRFNLGWDFERAVTEPIRFINRGNF